MTVEIAQIRVSAGRSAAPAGAGLPAAARAGFGRCSGFRLVSALILVSRRAGILQLHLLEY